jgi:CDP-6-deoxy-D-xylo-4-hexulose-3-dehydrase
MKEIITPLDRIKMILFIARTKKFTNGEMVKKFENEWSEWLGAKHSLYVSNGSTANFLLVAAIKEKYGLKDGDKVILPACTWVTNVAPIIQLGLQPIFCDINFENYSFDIDQLNEISTVHDDIKLIFVTHLLGFPADNNVYQTIFPNAIIIDDVCESHGSKFEDGSKVGSNSVGSTFSFYFGHHMTTIEGGMVSTNDSDLYDLMKMKRSHGMARESINFEEYAKQYSNIDKSFLFITDGYNFRNHELPAVLGISQLKKLDKTISIRRKNYKNFISMITKYEDFFHVPILNQGNSNFCFPLIVKNVEYLSSLKILLKKNNIEYRPVVGGNLLAHPFLKNYSMAVGPRGDKYNVETLESNGMYLGNNQFVSIKDIDILESLIKEVCYGR